MWLAIIIIAIVVGGIIGACSSKDGERGQGAAGGALAGGIGCGYILFQILLWGLCLMVFVWLFEALFC